jgi:hypothetical protein
MQNAKTVEVVDVVEVLVEELDVEEVDDDDVDVELELLVEVVVVSWAMPVVQQSCCPLPPSQLSHPWLAAFAPPQAVSQPLSLLQPQFDGN